MFKLPRLLPQIFIDSLLPKTGIYPATKRHYREIVTPTDHELSFDQANKPVNDILKILEANIKANQKILMVFDYDGTLTHSTAPDFTQITNVPDNIAKALERISKNSNIKVRVLTAKDHQSIHNVNLSPNIIRYSSDGLARVTSLHEDKLKLEVEANHYKYLEEAISLSERVLDDPAIAQLKEKGIISILPGIGNLAISIRSDYQKNSDKLKQYIRLKTNDFLPNKNWDEWSEFEEKFNIFYYSKELYNSNYEGKAIGVRRITDELQENGFTPDLIMTLGDSPNSDSNMMKEVKSWNTPIQLYKSINIAVGDKFTNEDYFTHKLHGNKDVYELILGIDRILAA